MKKVLVIASIFVTVIFVCVAVIGVAGFVGYRNLYPASNRALLPEKAADFNLVREFPASGNIWGTQRRYLVEYSRNGSGVTARLREHWSETGAAADFDGNKCERLDRTIEGMVKDKGGKPAGRFVYCSGTLHTAIGRQVLTVYPFALVKELTNSNDATVFELFKALPMARNLDLTSFSAAYPTLAKKDVPDANTESKSDSTPNYKALADKANELGRSAAKVQISQSPLIKGKVAVVAKRYEFSSDYEIEGFNALHTDFATDYDLKQLNLKKDRMALRPDEIDTLVRLTCNQGSVIGRYTSPKGDRSVPAYSMACVVDIVDYRNSTVIARKKLENRRMETTARINEGASKYVNLAPWTEIGDYLKTVPNA